MNHLYLISLLGILSAVAAACHWARMGTWRTTFHLIAAPVAIPVIGFTVYLGVAMPLALVSIGLDSIMAVNADALLEMTARTLSATLVVGMFLGYFYSEKSYLEAMRKPRTLRLRMRNSHKGKVPVVKFAVRKPIVDEYRRIRAKRFATGTVYILPRKLTPVNPNHPGNKTPPPKRPLGPLYATVRPKDKATPYLDESRFTWRSIEA